MVECLGFLALTICITDWASAATLFPDQQVFISFSQSIHLLQQLRLNDLVGGGTAIGGSSHLTWSKEPDLELSARMMKRAIEICPQLVPPGAGTEALQVVRHQVGFRPFRMGGPRVEKETLHDALGELRIVHCYGAGGFGFQASYGMADSVTKLVHHSLDMTSML